MKKALNVITTVITVIAVILAAALAGVRIFGLKTYTVLSPSMEPKYHVGSLIYVKKAAPETLSVGDDITFMSDSDTVATHRIIEVLDDGGTLSFRTQGLANDIADGNPVNEKNVIGKAVFTVPYLGRFASFIQNPPGIYLAVAAMAFLLALIFVPELFGKNKRKEN